MTLLERFEQKYIAEPNSGCWLWEATINLRGYGIISVGGLRGKMRPAHRVAWLLFRGEIPDGLFVLHRCDNRVCVNPDHLFLGTHQDNMDDMTRKGRRYHKGARKIHLSS